MEGVRTGGITERGGVDAGIAPRAQRVYPLVAHWAPGFDASQWTDALERLAARPDDSVAIDLHLPYCATHCLYCGCDVTVTHDEAEIDRYLDALQREMALATRHLGTRREVARLHLGGGTPNHLSDAQLRRLMDTVRRHFRVLPDSSLSIECDPRRCSEAQFATLRELGFAHVQFGMADLDPAVQHAAGRLQSFALMRDAIAMAREKRFESVQIELVCGLPQQTAAGLDRTLGQMLRLGPDRIALWRYEHAPARHWSQCAIDSHAVPDAAAREALWRGAADAVTGAGYEWIGCDLFVLEDDELAVARDRHELSVNCLGYLALPTDHALAFGRGRISDVAETLVASEPSLPRWQGLLAEGRWPLVRGCRRSDMQRARRDAIRDLVCELELHADVVRRGLEREYQRLAALAERGWVESRGDRLVVTREGHYHLAGLCRVLGDATSWAGLVQ